jgi:transcriptional regulator with XRE-family HTH domain
MRKQLTPLARHRIARGMTQRELARRLQVKPSAVCKWETGHARPEPKRIKELAEQLGVEPIRVAELLDVAPTQSQ